MDRGGRGFLPSLDALDNLPPPGGARSDAERRTSAPQRGRFIGLGWAVRMEF